MRTAILTLSPRTFAACICVLIPCLVTPLRAFAQRTSGGRDAPRIGVGVGFGGGNVPAGFHQTCGGNDRIAAASADLRAGIHFGSLRLEATTARRGAYVFSECLPMGPIGEDRVQTIGRTAAAKGELAITSLWIGRTFGEGNSRWLLSAGAGWAWTHHLPVLVLAGACVLAAAFDSPSTENYLTTALHPI